MKNTSIIFLVVTLALLVGATSVEAHDGRRLQVNVDSTTGQLYAQGVNTGADDGLPAIRPYRNAIHGHFFNSLTSTSALSEFPPFELIEVGDLQGHDLILTLMGAGKWNRVEMSDFDNPILEDLSMDDLIVISFDPLEVGQDDQVVDTDHFGGSVMLGENIQQPILDFHPTYEINSQPQDVLYFLEWSLSTSNASIFESGSIYTILSPDGSNPDARMHHQSLALERHFGVQAIPEPGSFAGGLLLLTLGALRRRRR